MKLICVNKSGEKLCNATLAQWYASWLKKGKNIEMKMEPLLILFCFVVLVVFYYKRLQ